MMFNTYLCKPHLNIAKHVASSSSPTLQEIAPGFPWCCAGLSQAIDHVLGHAPDFLVQWTFSCGGQFLWHRSCARLSRAVNVQWTFRHRSLPWLSQVKRLVTSVLKSTLLTHIFLFPCIPNPPVAILLHVSILSRVPFHPFAVHISAYNSHCTSSYVIMTIWRYIAVITW